MTSAPEPRLPASSPPKVLLLALAPIVAAFVLVPELGDYLPRTGDQTAVTAAAERVIVANQSVGIADVRDASGHVAPETIEALRAQVRETAAQLFTAAYRETWIERTYEVIDLETSSEFIFDGGASDFSRWRIVVFGGRAVVQVRCRIYLDMAQTFDGHRSRAENTVDYELTLERVDATWLVSGQSHRFASGGGP